MSTAETKQSLRKQKQKDQRALASSNGSERLKVVVRRLPSNLPEEVFWQSVQSWVSDETVSWKVFYVGKLRKRVNKESLPSRAYIAFKNEQVLATFSREYDGHVFRDKAGNESQAIVEFAPFQKVPTDKKKLDSRNNTIDKDEDYVSFLESLKISSKSEPVSIEALIAAAQPAPPPTTTPLLEALKAEKSAQRDKEAILRNHAHYKESAAAAKKEEAKKKAAANAQKQPGEPGSSMSKKEKKAAAAAAAAAQKASLHDTQPPVRIQTLGTKQPATASGAGPSPTLNVAAPRAMRERSHRHKAGAASSEPAAPLGTEESPVAAQHATAQTRRGRPVIGIGRHFEAALNGAIRGGERKKRDEKEKDKEGTTVPATSGEGGMISAADPGPNADAGIGTGKRKDHIATGGKHKHDKGAVGGSAQPPVPTILQHGGTPTSAGDTPTIPSSQSPQGLEVHVGGGYQTDSPRGRQGGGSGRRGRGRGRGGHRGG